MKATWDYCKWPLIILNYLTEVPRRLVGLLDFKSSVPVTSWWVGSIPMHFRHIVKSGSYNLECTQIDTPFLALLGQCDNFVTKLVVS